MTLLLLPGLWNSGPDHWQSHWERAGLGSRVVQRDWQTPDRAEWVATLEAAVRAAQSPVVLAAHSLACTLVAHWAQTGSVERVRGALLVAPSDCEAPTYPSGTTGFVPMPLAPLPFRSIVVFSTNDEYVSASRAIEFATRWGARGVDAGALGHINSASQLGMWPAGLALLDELR